MNDQLKESGLCPHCGREEHKQVVCKSCGFVYGEVKHYEAKVNEVVFGTMFLLFFLWVMISFLVWVFGYYNEITFVDFFYGQFVPFFHRLGF